MAAQYQVKQGDCLSSIAFRHGFQDWHTIYDHPKNAEFRAKRPNPNVLYPGDEIFLPDLEQGEECCATEKKHKFVLQESTTYVDVRLQNVAKQPLRNARFKLCLGSLEVGGTTDGQGRIRCRIPATAEFGTLLYWPDPQDPADVMTLRVLLGHLDPHETISGVKARLNNLGYRVGEIDNEQNAAYECAVRRFQEQHGLVVDGVAGPETLAKLNEEHQV